MDSQRGGGGVLPQTERNPLSSVLGAVYIKYCVLLQCNEQNIYELVE